LALVYKYEQGNLMAENQSWYNQDTFWTTFESLLFNQKRLADTASQVDHIIKLLQLKESAKILDLCSGIGRHSLEFARRGFQVTGVDRTKTYLDKAKNQAKTAGLNIEFVNEDMRTFLRADTFDVVVNMFTSFGYFEDAEDDRQVIDNVYASLKSGGKFLIEMMGKEILGRDFRERDWNEINGLIILEDRKLLNNWEKIQNRWIILTDDKRVEHNFVLRLYSAKELTLLLKQCGFSHAKVYGSLEGLDYDHKAKRLVVVATK
jgi:SAM-dependent methyltransferase